MTTAPDATQRGCEVPALPLIAVDAGCTTVRHPVLDPDGWCWARRPTESCLCGAFRVVWAPDVLNATIRLIRVRLDTRGWAHLEAERQGRAKGTAPITLDSYVSMALEVYVGMQRERARRRGTPVPPGVNEDIALELTALESLLATATRTIEALRSEREDRAAPPPRGDHPMARKTARGGGRSGQRIHPASEGPTPAKASRMLKDDSAQGKPLTRKQKGFFGARARQGLVGK